MKQKLAVLALVLSGAALVQTQTPSIDPTGARAIEQLKERNGGSLPKTGLIADPTGTAVFKAVKSQKKP